GSNVAAHDGCVAGRQDVREEDGRLVGDVVGEAAERAVGVGAAHELRLAAVQPRVDARVAEERAALALRDPPGGTGRTGAVRDHARVHDPLARTQPAHRPAGGDDLARELVPEYGSRLEARG